MYDMHCHILPGLDDGSPSMEESVAMARELEANGFKGVFATPHVLSKEGSAPGRAAVAAGVEILSATLRDEGVGLQVMVGSEYHYDRPLPELMKKFNPLTTLNGSDYVLLELPMMVWPEYLEYSVIPDPKDPPEYARQLAYLRPVIAHPERNQEVMRDYKKLMPLRDLGYLFQVNIESINGLAGKHALKAVKKMGKAGLIDLVGSDGHKSKFMKEYLPGWKKRAAKIIGKNRAEQVLEENPARIAENKHIDIDGYY